jgi:predicted dehydrogenase/threonine dehydrogenase-like Zn-dependent dehydrogenase
VKQVLLKQGGVFVAEVPAPQVEPNCILVRAAFSCVSVGTEMSGVKASNLPLWKRALERPDQIGRVIRMVATDGLARTRDAVQSRLAQASPIGYSLAGTVIGVGDGVDDIAIGDAVACAGAQSAHHAEIVCVPRNLAVPVLEGLDLADASTVTLGAIALQGLRRGSPTLGETFVVVGLGILGQIAVQLLKTNGVRVIGIDPDRSRIAAAQAAGLDIGLHPDDTESDQQVARLTGGVGADGVIITAASASHDILSGAFRMSRRKGRVVLVGDVGLNIDRADIYAKELDFLVSTSYGPGRYDRNYEERGLDYPVGYVRWTENRNMQAYLSMLAAGRVQLHSLLEVRYPIEQAPAAYAALASDVHRPMTVLLTYPQIAAETIPLRRIANVKAVAPCSDAVRVALVGAGGFAKGTHLPILRAHPDAFHLRAVCTRQGHNAAAVTAQYGAAFSTTDYADILADADTDAVIIATRHDRHGDMVLQALKSGKHVFVEKPLCLTEAELVAIEEFYAEEGVGAPILLTGFNRRFSRYAQAIIAAASQRSNPLVMTYRVNAGHIPADHWVHGAEGGGRNRGEACHFYDLFIAIANSAPEAVSAASIRHAGGYYRNDDNFSATIRFANGSLATLVYTALGAESFPKERLDVFFDGKVYAIDNFMQLEVSGAKGLPISTPNPAKGHEEEFVAFARAIRRGGEWPIPLWQQLAATRIALQVESQLG